MGMLLWFCAMPPLLLVVMGLRWGMVLIASLGCVAAVALHRGMGHWHALPPDLVVEALGAFAIIAAVSIIYESVRMSSLNRSHAMNRQLSEALVALGEKERQLVISEHRLRDIALSSSDVIWEIDSEGRYVFVSGRIEDVLGYRAEEMLGRSIAEFMPASEYERIFVQHGPGAQVPLHRFSDVQRRALHKSGRIVMMQTSGFAFSEASGVCSGYRGIDKDITERVRAEQERALLQNRMQVAQKMEAVGQLAGGIAHDFNNILGAIAGYADMIKQFFGADNKRLVKYADTILAAATRASDLTTKLLNFARKGSYRVVRIDINHALEDLVALLSHSLDKRISIELRAGAPGAWVKADPSQLHTVLMSLAVNAADAMPQGGRLTFETQTIYIDADFIKRHRYEMVEAQYLVLAVTDNGVGMDSHTRARVFEPFFTTKEPGRGTGLGLASAYGIIKTMGGAINVYTELGMGTTFRLYLPLAEEQLAQAALAESMVARVVQPSGLVLLVDDERFMLDICRDMLMALGYEVAEFDNPDDAVRWYEVNHNRVRLVIIDMIMPAATGSQCLKRLLCINPQVCAILATGFAFTDDIEELLQEGFCAYIQKPFVMKQLADVVATALRKA